jgi:hypothetical protein
MKEMKTLRFDGGEKERLKEAGQIIESGETFEVSAPRAKQLLANPFVKVSEVRLPRPISAPKPADKPRPATFGGNKQEGDEKA